MPPAHRIVAAVSDLGPESRAVIELSARRRMSEEQLAELLRVDPAEVRRRCERATEELGAALDLARPDELRELRRQLERMDADAWRGREPEPEKERAPRRARGVVIGTVVVAMGVAAAVVIGAQGDDDDEPAPPVTQSPKRPAPAAQPPTRTGRAAQPPTPPAPRAGPVVTFQRLNDTHGRGTVRLIRFGDRARLRLRISSLLRPKGGGYEAWLYNSPTDARQLTATKLTSFVADLRLPRNYARYRFVDVSREPTDDPSHGRLSLLRAPLKALEP